MEAAYRLFNRLSLPILSRRGAHYRLGVRTYLQPSLLSMRVSCVQYKIKNNFQILSSSSSTHLDASLQTGLCHINDLRNSRNYSTQSSDSDKGNLVYVGRVGSMFRMLKLFSLTTSTVGLSLQPYLFMTYQDAPLVTALPFFAALNMFVFVNPLLIHHIGKKYVMEVYFDQRTKVFTAVLLSFFARKYNFTFTADDVQIPDVPGMFAILTIKGRPLFVLESDFTDLEVYKHMMGFDKPLDLSFLKDSKKD